MGNRCCMRRAGHLNATILLFDHHGSSIWSPMGPARSAAGLLGDDPAVLVRLTTDGFGGKPGIERLSPCAPSPKAARVAATTQRVVIAALPAVADKDRAATRAWFGGLGRMGPADGVLARNGLRQATPSGIASTAPDQHPGPDRVPIPRIVTSNDSPAKPEGNRNG